MKFQYNSQLKRLAIYQLCAFEQNQVCEQNLSDAIRANPAWLLLTILLGYLIIR